MFPEIRNRLKSFFDDAPISLGLKTDWITANTTEAAKLARIWAAVGAGFSSWSGESVTLQSALQNSVVWASRSVLAGTMGYLPATVKQERDGVKRDATDLPIFSAMKWEPNEEISSQDFRELKTTHCMFTGGGFSQIIRRSGGDRTALQLRQLVPEQVGIDREKAGQKRLVYVIHESGNADRTYTVEAGKPQDIFHLRGAGWDGIRGFNVLQYAKQSIGLAIAADKNVGNFWARGGRLPSHLTLAPNQKFKDDDDAAAYRAKFRAIYDNPHEIPILTDGQKLDADGLTLSDSQSIEFRQNIVSEITRWWDIPPHLVGDLLRATFSNIEELALQFEKITLSKWIGRWNSDFRRCVLTPDEKAKGYYLHHNLDALRRGDFAARMMAFASALQNGWLNRDEVRGLEDLNPIPDGSGAAYTIQSNMQTLDATAQLAQRVRLQKNMGVEREDF